MQAIGIRELRDHASEIFRRVREEGTAFDVTYRGRLIARLVPVAQPALETSVEEFWERWDRLSREISAHGAEVEGNPRLAADALDRLREETGPIGVAVRDLIEEGRHR